MQYQWQEDLNDKEENKQDLDTSSTLTMPDVISL